MNPSYRVKHVNINKDFGRISIKIDQVHQKFIQSMLESWILRPTDQNENPNISACTCDIKLSSVSHRFWVYSKSPTDCGKIVLVIYFEKHWLLLSIFKLESSQYRKLDRNRVYILHQNIIQ